jgi:hypothetical protein
MSFHPSHLDTDDANFKVSFVEAMDKMIQVPSPISSVSLGENGQPEVAIKDMTSNPEDALIAIYAGLLRDSIQEISHHVPNSFLKLDSSRLSRLMHGFMSSIELLSQQQKAEYSCYLICLLYHTRDCRGGKGERAIFRYLLLESYKHFPKTVEALVQYIPHYGYWKDLNELLVDTYNYKIDGVCFDNLRNIIYTFISDQLKIDFDNYTAHKEDEKSKLVLTLAAKYAPKEGSSYDRKIKAAKEIAMRLFPIEFKTDFRMALKSYRRMISSLNAAIQTTEILMCNNQFSEINFSRVPGKCLSKYRSAFLNQKLENKNDLRYPDVEDRMKCRENLLQFMLDVKSGKKQINAGQLFIHEIVGKLLDHIQRKIVLSQEEIDLFELCWNEIVKTYRDMVSSGEISLKHGMILADVSGSMEGTPMQVSIATAIFISSFLNEPYCDRFMTFSTVPSWFYIDPSLSLLEKVHIVSESPWGGSTNFEKAMSMILEVATTFKLEPEETPKWFLVLSDMQFDLASGNKKWETMHEHLREMFATAGLKACGKPYEMPYFIYWNLRGNTEGLPVVSNEPGCSMVSGYSIAILKELFKNRDLKNITPWTNLKSTLDSERYELIKNMVISVAEKPYFEHYKIVANSSSNDSVSTEKSNPPRKGFFNLLSSLLFS